MSERTINQMDVAATVVIDCLDDIAIGDRPLLVDEESGLLAVALQQRGAEPVEWLRLSCRRAVAQVWPTEAVYSSCFIRLPKAKEALEFALHAAASVLAAGAPIIVFGANDEGIRSAPKLLATVADGIQTLSIRRHCRVSMGTRAADIVGLKGRLQDWRAEKEVVIAGLARRWASYPGTFAKGEIDAGSKLLIDRLGRSRPRARVLDFAAGTGVIAAAVLQAWPTAKVDMIEIDTLAQAAAKENVPLARSFPGDALSASQQRHYDLIITNPPIHEGIRESTKVLEKLIAEAPARLGHDGELRIVVLRHIPAVAMIERAFGTVTTIAEDGRFRVLSAKKQLQG